MGVKHLIRTRELLRSKPDDAFTKGQIRKETGQNAPQVDENLDYLMEVEQKVRMVSENKYQWVQE